MSASSVFLTILIPTKNRQDLLDRLISSISLQTYADYEILIIDDGSNPPTRASGPKIKVIRNSVSVGACRARNVGLQIAKGVWIMLFDDDTELRESNLLERIVIFADAHPQIGAIALAQLKPDGKPAELQTSASQVPCYAPFFCGCAAVIRREAIQQVGGFNEWFSYYYEEMELSMRLLDADFEIVYNPTLAVVHFHDPRGRNWVRLMRLVSRNAVHTVLIRFPWWMVIPALVSQLTKFLITTMQAKRYDWRGFFWILKESATSIPTVVKTRKAVRFSTLKRYKALQRNPVPI